MSPEALKGIKERGGICIKVTLTVDAEPVYKSLISRNLKIPTEKTLLGHMAWLREWLLNGIIESLQWCDTRDMTADGHTTGSVDRSFLIELMSGQQQYRYDVKRHTPYRGQSAP